MRGKQSEKDSHWNDKNHLNDRAFFRTVTEPATLNINHIEERDGGEYRCRVDFAKSPTRNSRIHLTVIGLYIIKERKEKERFRSATFYTRYRNFRGKTEEKCNQSLTWYFLFFLYISVPPHKPNIIDEHGTIVQTVTGPYEENEDMKLQCLVSGGEFSQVSVLPKFLRASKFLFFFFFTKIIN